MKKPLLYAFVFASGAVILALELSASRLLAPFFGSSLFVWGNIIGVVLASLAVGYWVGGRVASRGPSIETLGFLTWLAGVSACAIPLLSSLVLRGVSDVLAGLPYFLAVASFVAVILLFAGPLILLAALSPLAVRLGADSLDDVGRVSGTLSAFGTAGSLFGAFIPAFVTIPLLGTRATILGAGGLMILLGGLALRRKRALAALILPIVLLIGLGRSPASAAVFEKESPYQHIRVVKGDDGRNMLLVNEGLGVQTWEIGPDGLTGSYLDAATLMPLLAGDGPKRIAVIGMAGGSVIRQFRSFMPPEEIAGIDAVEIDPEMPAIAKAHFGLRDEDASIFIEDGRTFLSRPGPAYDLILVDAYRDALYVPPHLATAEFFATVARRLAPEGILALNVIGTDEDDPLVRAFLSTLAGSFPAVGVSPIPGSYNHLIIAGRRPPDWQRLLEAAPPALRGIAQDLAAAYLPMTQTAPGSVMTDDRAPVEYLTDGFIWRTLRSRQ
jgi:spermidine synthase